jgi:hypothetical protein
MAKVRHPFDEATLQSWQRSFSNSPQGKYTCECGHQIYLESKHWNIEKHRGKWFVKVLCLAPCADTKCGSSVEYIPAQYTSKVIYGQCRHVNIQPMHKR